MKSNISFLCFGIIFLAGFCIDPSYGRHGRKFKRELEIKTTPKPTTTTEEVRIDDTQLRRDDYIKTEETKEDASKISAPPTNIMDTKEDLDTRRNALDDLSKQILQSSLLATEDIRLKTNNTEIPAAANRLELNKYYTISFF